MVVIDEYSVKQSIGERGFNFDSLVSYTSADVGKDWGRNRFHLILKATLR